MTVSYPSKLDRAGLSSQAGFARRFLGIVLLALLCISQASSSYAQQDSGNGDEVGTEDASYASIVIDLSLVQKIIADEAFIRGESCSVPGVILNRTEGKSKLRLVDDICKEALNTPEVEVDNCIKTKRLYCKAVVTLKKVNPDNTRLPVSKKNTHVLLSKDVAYRLFLLDQAVAFWGGARSLVPTIPIRHVRVMNVLLEDFEEQVLEMHGFIESIKKDQDKIERVKAYAEEVRGRFRAQKINETTAVIRRRDSDVNLTTIETRFDHLEQQRGAINKEAEKLRIEADRVASGAEKFIAEAVMGSVGVPPGVVEAVQTGDLEGGIKQAVLNTVAKDFAQGDSGMIGKLAKDMGKSTQEFVALYQQGKELHDRFQEGKKTFEGAKELLRKPSLDRLLNLGYHVSAQLAPEDRKKLESRLDKVAPVASLYDAIRTVRSKPPSEACKALLDNPLVAGQLNFHDSSACGLVDVTLPKSCKPETIQKFERACSAVSKDSPECKVLRRGCNIKNHLTTEVNRLDKKLDNVSLLVEEALIGIIDQADDEIVGIYAGLLNELSSVKLNDDVLVQVLDEAATVWSRDIITFILDKAGSNRQKAIHALAKALKYNLIGNGTGDVHEMAKLVANNGLSRLKMKAKNGDEILLFKLSRGNLLINNPANPRKPLVKNIKVRDILGLPSVESAQRAAREGVLRDLKLNVRESLKKLAKQKKGVRGKLTKFLKPEAVEMIVEKGMSIEKNPYNNNSDFGKIDEEENRQAFWKRMTQGAKNDPSAQAVKDYGVSLLVGGAAATDLREVSGIKQNTFTPPPAQPVGNAGGAPTLNDALTEQAITLALDAALPGAGVAFKVAQSLVALDVNIKRQNRLAEDSVRLAMMMIDAQDEADRELLRLVLAQKDEELARVLQQAAENQLQIYDFGIKEAAEDAAMSRARIKIRRALTFYVAERLREEFDLFNRSMGLWAGEANEPSTYVIRQIKSDPRNLRLALDPEIHLFDWLEREGEATRTDVDSLMAHWRQLVRLSIDLCQIRGCTPGGGRLGQTAQTGLLTFSDLLSASEFTRFNRWQQDPGDHPFETEILVHPDIPGFPPSYLNLRYVEMRLGWVSLDGGYVVPHGVVVEHPGMGVVASQGEDGTPEFHRELLLKRRTSTFNLPHPFSLENLRNRWEDNNDREPSVFEGYGLFSRLRVTIHPTRDALEADDLGMRIAYSYTDPEHVVTEQDFIRSVQSKKTYHAFYEVLHEDEDDKNGREFIIEPYYDALCIRPKDKNYNCSNSNEPTIPIMSQFIVGKSAILEPGKDDRFFSRKCAKPIGELKQALTVHVAQLELDKLRRAAQDDKKYILDLDALNKTVAAEVTAEIVRIQESFGKNKGWLKTCPPWKVAG